jgi:vacuolar-type H+-ATPase subunit E/Vma4
MALKDILHVIAADAERKAVALREAADDAYQAGMEAAEAEAREECAEIVAAAQRQAEQEKVRALHRVRLEDLRQQVQVQQAAFVAAVNAAQLELSAARQRPNYEELLARLLDEAAGCLDAPVVLVVHPEDRTRIEALAHAQGIEAQAIELRDDLAPGVIVRTPDGRVAVDNTLTSRLLRAQADLHALLADLLVMRQETPAGRA